MAQLRATSTVIVIAHKLDPQCGHDRHGTRRRHAAAGTVSPACIANSTRLAAGLRVVRAVIRPGTEGFIKKYDQSDLNALC